MIWDLAVGSLHRTDSFLVISLEVIFLASAAKCATRGLQSLCDFTVVEADVKKGDPHRRLRVISGISPEALSDN